ncbi:GNAT family N-acetyltransferase [Pseudemcibacter aquimaris]|uniref:GNAT family N-acetyltransferase n=1 Tax=Pseudemcibacter aquimaris TaxID=2857064 RepID=UPI002012AA85|nr:GNAT family N-acetyltransferase [Pseudemcibacter aquimaris]MCC3860282.1 GNAT family N-acetyltransferase [Pseudemcibacter aquimaris]WDU57607.1 GNAT family N-acetyltransferase [Pseudemcibacter aquimaris]
MDYIIRPAKKEEAYELAQLVNQAGQGPGTRGLDFTYWSMAAKDGQDPYEIGQKTVEDENDPYSYNNMRVLEVDNDIAALAMCFEAWTRTAEEMAKIPTEFQVFKHLTNEIPGEFYLDSIAAKPEYRGKGYGQIMLQDCIDQAKSKNYNAVYLIAFDKNAPGVGLYEKNGFYPVRDLPNTDHPDMPYQGGKIVLYKKDL